jgi:hypothetical protein
MKQLGGNGAATRRARGHLCVENCDRAYEQIETFASVAIHDGIQQL